MNVDPQETGLPLTAHQVRAVLDGRKTTHRLVAKFKSIEAHFPLTSSSLSVGDYHAGIPGSGTVLQTIGAGGVLKDRTYPLDCPLGKPGDRLWVQEEWNKHCGQVTYREDGDWIADFAREEPKQLAALKKQGADPEWQPAENLPVDLSRAHLEVTAVRVERLKSITKEQAVAEGLIKLPESGRYTTSLGDQLGGRASNDPREVFFWMWALNGGAWKSNPWVWVIDFKRVEDAA